ncbi:hypothetical protein TU54_16475 [Bacillus cereus]|nr:hypothetical protein TU54_16475 [Bacillus cereus]KXX83513.1 hypothetical protein AT277_26280 [Bacillus cereus]KXZ01538.1 hypothetical protein AT276_24740 [Bacillus cereus]
MIEGLGSSIKGVWGKVPQWVRAKPEVWFLPCFCMVRQSRISVADHMKLCVQSVVCYTFY